MTEEESKRLHDAGTALGRAIREADEEHKIEERGRQLNPRQGSHPQILQGDEADLVGVRNAHRPMVLNTGDVEDLAYRPPLPTPQETRDRKNVEVRQVGDARMVAARSGDPYRAVFVKGHPSVVRVPDDEPVFVIRGRDALGPDAIRAWMDLAEGRRVNPAKLAACMVHLEDMLSWQRSHPDLVKVPD